MKRFASQRKPLGESGLLVPSIVFGTAALANVSQVIPEQRKLEICAAWLQSVAAPVWVDVAYRNGEGMALEVLGRMLHRLDVAADEIVVHLTLDSDRITNDWEKSSRLLGSDYAPKLVSLRNANDEAWRAAWELKAARAVRGVGMVMDDLAVAQLTPPPDWIVLTRGFTLMRHSTAVLASMQEFASQQIPVIVSGVFDGGFLTGSNRLDGRAVSTDDPTDRSLLAWRTSFVALCHGHSVNPAQACIQFALSGPGVAAVLLESSRPERVAENVESVERKAPDSFWASMKEEGLVAADYPLGE